jgi:ribonucleoside-diphosphate reductase beta chain
MLATGRMINYIRRDELTHVSLFAAIFKELKKERPDLYDEKLIIEMMDTAVDQEIAWSKHILANSVIGMSDKNIEDYTRWLANGRMHLLGHGPIYPEAITNPYKHLDRIQNTNGERANFFESTVTNYTQSSGMNGSWEF